MGWTSFEVTKGRKTADVIAEEFGSNYEIVEHATKGRAFYAAVRRKDTGRTFAAVVLVNRRSNGRWAPTVEFAYKDQTESMGPVDAEAPAKVLDALDPVEDLYEGSSREWAAKWRQRCRENIARREQAAQVTPGTRVRFAQPMEFTDGVSRQEFTFEGRSIFRADDGARVRITSWRTREDWEVAA